MLSGLAGEEWCDKQLQDCCSANQIPGQFEQKLHMHGKKAVVGLDYIKGESKKPQIKLSRGTQTNIEKNKYIRQ